MPHRRLGRSQRHSCLRQMRSERVAQRVDVDSPPPLVALGYLGRLQIPVQDAYKARRDVKKLQTTRKPIGNRFALSEGFLALCAQLFG
ncbi:MAG TPA: hypothetical protein PLD73_12095 [Candidatus Hydrogenedentes bacterium]|nr:hypothetical protein [Candidatus Hydrogenedentota bacterium]